MNRCDFSSISTCLKNHISESNQLSQPDFLYELFEDFMDDPTNQDFSMDNGLVCRWLTGQAKISPKISAYYSKPSNQKKLAETIHQNLLPLMFDCNMAMQDIYTLFIQDDTISDAKKKNLASLYKPANSRLLFLAKLISFGMERQFIKRDTKNQKLIAGGALSPIVLDYIMDSEVPKPCRHFIGRDKELEELYTMLEENRHVFLCGIAGIGKSELAKAYAKHYKKHYTNILYVEYTGNLHQDITDMDFIDDFPESTEQERFQRHNRFLRSLKSDTLLIIDNFNVTATQDSFLSVVLKYRCQILFTTRSNLKEYCTFQLKEIKDINTLFQLTSAFYSDAARHRSTVETISSCHTLLDSLQQICLVHGIEVDYYKKLFQTVGNIIELIEKDDMPKYLLFLENVFPYMDNYNYQKGMKEIIQELKSLLKNKDIDIDSDWALLLDFQATLETKPEKAMQLEKDALALIAEITEITEENAHLISNLHSNLGGLYRMNGYPDLAVEHMEKGLFLLEQYNLLYTHDGIPQATNYAMFLTEQQAPEKGISILQKLSKGIKEYNSDCCLDYATVQETLGTIYLMTANLPQAKTHFKRACKIYEKIWADEPEMIEVKYQEIQELYPQAGIALAQNILIHHK